MERASPTTTAIANASREDNKLSRPYESLFSRKSIVQYIARKSGKFLG